MQGEPKKDYLKELKKRTIWRRIVACLAVVVAVSTGYALILPAVTMEQQAVSESKKETEADWEATLPDALTGEWGTDLAAVAQSQIGYTESSTDTAVNDTGENCGYTRYGAWYGDEYGDWNGMFLAFCLHYAEIPEDAVKASADVSEMLKAAQEKGFYKEAGQYEPEAGDIAFLPDTQAGIVTEVSPEGVSVTAGDINGTVAVIEKAEPLGYGSMETAALYTGNEAERQPENEEGKSPSEQDGTAAGSDGDQPTDGGADSEVQADQTNGLDSGGTSQPAGDTGEEQAGGENEAAEQAEQYLDLKDYVNKRDFGNEAAAFEEKLIDANGQTIEPDGEGIYHIYEGEAYRWSINLYAPAGLPEAGTYEYPLPENIKAEGISVQEITADDGTLIGTLEVSEDRTKVLVHIVDNTKIRVRVYFEICLDIELDEEGVPANQEFVFIPNEEPTVEKSHEITSEGKIEWCIRIHAPGWKEGDYPSLSMYDLELDGRVGYCPDYSKAEITITQNGNTLVIPSVEEAGDKDLAWYAANDNNLWFVSRKTSHTDCCGDSKEKPIGLPEEWCTDWCQTEDSVITVKYIEEKYDITNAGTNITNTAYVGNESAVDVIKIPGMIDKGDINNQTGEFTITVNPGLIDLSAQTHITVQDSMGSHLFYQGGSMSITATDEDGIEQVLTYGSDYSLEVSQELHHLEINILHPGKYIYTITYKVYVMTGGNKDGEEYINTATLNVFGREFKDESSGYEFDSSGEEYVISIRKTEQESQEVVAGAEYGLYGSNGELMATGTTDGSGEFTFVGDPANGFILASGQLYYIQETKAPEGYYLSDTRYWFYYDDSEENVDYDNYIKNLLSAAELEGLYRETDQLIENVLNHGYTDKEIVTGSNYADPIEVQDQLIWYELPETGSTGTRMYTIAGLLLTGSAITALYREKCKKRRNKK